jgi:hypothetical protein
MQHMMNSKASLQFRAVRRPGSANPRVARISRAPSDLRFCRIRTTSLPLDQSISATPADCEPLWQTIFGCVLFAAVCGLVMIVL